MKNVLRMFMHNETIGYEFIEDLILRTPYLPKYIGESDEELLSNQKILEAIYLASPVLCQQLTNESKKNNAKLQVSFYKYLSRMSTRCTPFGLFAGISPLKWGEDTNITIDGEVHRKTRLDMAYLCKLADEISKNVTIRHSLRYFSNNTLYQTGESLRYIELQYINSARSYQISSTTKTDYLEVILKMATQGVKLEVLAEYLVDDDISYQDAYDYLFELIDNRLLVWELEPKVTDEIDYGKTLFDFLDTHPDLIQDEYLLGIYQTLKEVLPLLERLDEDTSDKIEVYKRIFQRLSELNTPIQEGNLFQVDYMRGGGKSALNTVIQTELLEVLEVLRHLNYRMSDSLLNTFKERFYAKYEDREIPLQSVLDTDIGLVYGSDVHSDASPLIDDISLSSYGAASKKVNWYDQNSFLLKALSKCLANGGKEINLETENFSDTLPKMAYEEMPDSLSAIFKVIDAKQSKILFEYFGGSSAINVLGRFAYFDEHTHEIINEIVRRERLLLKPNEVFAEIIHFPEDRIGNIILRPSFHDYEIPYLTPPSSSGDKVIRIEDLVLSMKQGKFILKSVKNGLIVKPRLSNAHNFSNKSLPVYRFLCDLQSQDRVGGMSFDWTVFFTSQFDFLPRVCYKSVILSPAIWMLRSKHLQPLKQNEASPDKLREMLATLNIPTKIIIAEGDNELMLDFSKEICVATFFDYIKKRESITIKEYLLDSEDMVVHDEDGNAYNSQFIAPIVKKTAKPFHHELSKVDLHLENVIDFQPGDRWLYYKLYCGSQSADKILTENLPLLLDKLYAKGLIEECFFIRFSDPDWHLRLRFLLTSQAALGTVIQTVKEELSLKISSGMIAKVQIDTYKPEFKRYGSNTIELSERLFSADSEFVVTVLAELESYSDAEELRWLIALKGIDMLLNDFGYDLEDKMRLMSTISQSFNNEFNLNKLLKVQIDSKFRRHRSQISSILETNSENLITIHSLIAKRSEKISVIAQDILAIDQKGQLKVSLDDLLASYLHMHVNRLMKSRQRMNELLLYYFLDKYYASVYALKRKALKFA